MRHCLGIKASEIPRRVNRSSAGLSLFRLKGGPNVARCVCRHEPRAASQPWLLVFLLDFGFWICLICLLPFAVCRLFRISGFGFRICPCCIDRLSPSNLKHLPESVDNRGQFIVHVSFTQRRKFQICVDKRRLPVISRIRRTRRPFGRAERNCGADLQVCARGAGLRGPPYREQGPPAGRRRAKGLRKAVNVCATGSLVVGCPCEGRGSKLASGTVLRAGPPARPSCRPARRRCWQNK